MSKKVGKPLTSEVKQVPNSGPKVADDSIYLIQRDGKHRCHEGFL